MAAKLMVKSNILGGSKTITNTITGWARSDDFIRQEANADKFSFLTVDENNKVIKIKSGNWTLNQKHHSTERLSCSGFCRNQTGAYQQSKIPVLLAPWILKALKKIRLSSLPMKRARV